MSDVAGELNMTNHTALTDWPLIRVPLDQLGYRWEKYGWEKQGYGLVEVYHQIEELLKNQAKPNPQMFATRYQTRYPAILGVCNSFRKFGMQNYLIICRIGRDEPARYLVMKGNQRLCALRTFDKIITGRLERDEDLAEWVVWQKSMARGIPCRVTEDFKKEHHILGVYPYKKVPGSL